VTLLELIFAVRNLRDPRIAGAPHHVLSQLVLFRNEGAETIAVAVSQLAATTGLHRATVLRALATLRELGYLTAAETTNGMSGRYTVNVPTRSSRPPELVAPRNRSQCATGSITLLEQSHHATGRNALPVASSASTGRFVHQTGSTMRPSEDLSEDLSEDHTNVGSEFPEEPESREGPKAKPTGKPGSKARIEATWACYVAAWQREIGGSNPPKLSPSRRKLIARRLAEFPPEDLEQAVRGMFASPHHLGQNPTNTRYLSPELLFRDVAHVERFRDMAPQRPTETSDDAEPVARSENASQVNVGGLAANPASAEDRELARRNAGDLLAKLARRNVNRFERDPDELAEVAS